MAPTRGGREASIDYTPEYEEFLAQLETFHAARGTSFEPTPRVGSRRVDLLRLYKRVLSEGGYDAVSDTKQHKLAWRRLGQDFNLGTSNLPALAFNLKTAYYRNLAAFEIATFHNREPPPREILEDVSAKGGGLLTRTLENYRRPISRDEQLGMSQGSDGSDVEGQGSSQAADSMDIDESGSGGRTTRGLRHAPPQRVLFQPDISSSRQTRHSSANYSSPAPMVSGSYGGVNGSHNLNGLSPALANYEPRQQHPLSLKPVITPANNPELFKQQQRELRDARLSKQKAAQNSRGMMLPGTGFTGPNIYIRALLSLQCGILEEQEYALHHLVRISHERGDKYRFDGFPGLAEALIDKVLEISSLFTDVEWAITYQDDEKMSERETLDGLNGTIDILDRIQAAIPIMPKDQMVTKEFAQRLGLVNEAALVIRNMVMLDENAEYISRLPTIRDALVILLNLPSNPASIEIKHYALEIAEQLTKFYALSPQDPLHLALLSSVDSADRGEVLTALRAISRQSLHLEHNARLQDIPVPAIQRLCEWVLVEDEELRSACLDFLYQYTAVIENVDTLLRCANVEGLVKQLVRLLLHNAQLEERRERPRIQPKQSAHEDVPIPRISADLIQDLLGYDEPERSSQWLRACFEEDSTGEITQIALWQAYQVPFAPFGHQRPLLPAKDFITNVSHTFSSASAQVMPTQPPKFVIKGIRPRKVPVDRQGRFYMRCLWHVPDCLAECGEFALRPKNMWQHVVTAHLNIPKDSEGHFDFSASDTQSASCHWAECTRFAKGREASPYTVGMHVKTHLPDTAERASKRQRHNHSSDLERPEPTEARSWPVRNTQTDERNDAAGLPLTSALVLRNLARNIPRIDPGGSGAQPDEDGTLVWKIFSPIKEQLYFVMAYNQSLREYLPQLTKAIEAAER